MLDQYQEKIGYAVNQHGVASCADTSRSYSSIIYGSDHRRTSSRLCGSRINGVPVCPYGNTSCRTLNTQTSCHRALSSHDS